MNSEDGLKKSGLNREIMVSLAEFVFYQGSEKNVIQIYNEWSKIHHFYQPDPDLAAGILDYIRQLKQVNRQDLYTAICMDNPANRR